MRNNYKIYQSPNDKQVCIKEATTDESVEFISKQYQGWVKTNKYLGNSAPSWCRMVNSKRLEMEFIPGRTLNQVYGTPFRPRNNDLTYIWDDFFYKLRSLWEKIDSGRNVKLTAESLWCTWYSIADLQKAKRFALLYSLYHPIWSLSTIVTWFKYYEVYTKPPDIVIEILSNSKKGLILGDLVFENVLLAKDRLVFVDFADVAYAEIAFDLVWIWLAWWLAQGLLHGDDGFLTGFRNNWKGYVGSESLLCEMTREWIRRLVPWLLVVFARFSLSLGKQESEIYGSIANELKKMVSSGQLSTNGSLNSFLNLPVITF